MSLVLLETGLVFVYSDCPVHYLYSGGSVLGGWYRCLSVRVVAAVPSAVSVSMQDKTGRDIGSSGLVIRALDDILGK